MTLETVADLISTACAIGVLVIALMIKRDLRIRREDEAARVLAENARIQRCTEDFAESLARARRLPDGMAPVGLKTYDA